jgi:hypothetical protein
MESKLRTRLGKWVAAGTRQFCPTPSDYSISKPEGKNWRSSWTKFERFSLKAQPFREKQSRFWYQAVGLESSNLISFSIR